MSKYIRIYNELTKVMGVIELIFLWQVKPSHRNENSTYIYGPYIYCKLTRLKYSNFIKCNCDLETDKNGNVLKKKEKHFCKNYFYKETNNASDVNAMQDFNKFIMDKSGNIYTTATGLVFLKYYYLGRRDEIHEELYTKHLDLILHTVHLKNNDLFCKNVRTIFLLKKKHKLPRFITYMVILHLCKLFLSSSYNYKLSSKSLNYRCGVCCALDKKMYECDTCGVNYCRNCAYNKNFCNRC